MRVNEIFYSIDGEGIRTGELVVFIRLAGCNLRCSYCDTAYALKNTQGTEMSIKDILKEVGRYCCNRVTLTGGEPLIHADADKLVRALLHNGYEVNIETNGSVDIRKFRKRNTIITMDWKTPTSNQMHMMLHDNLEKLRKQDVLKFVVGSWNDLDVVKRIMFAYDVQAQIFISPVFGKIEAKDIVEYMKACNLQKARVQVQLHKVIWDPNLRGV